MGVLFPVMPVFAKELGLSSGDFGMVVSVVGISRLVMNVPAAWLTDRYGRRMTLVGGPVLSGIGMGLTGFSRSLYDLVGVRFLTGVGGSLQMTGAQMYLSDISTPANRARTMAPTGIGFAIGATIGPAIGGTLADNFGLVAPFAFVTTAIAMVSILNFMLLPETRKHVPAANAKKKSLAEEFRHVSSQWKPLLMNHDIRSVLALHFTYWCAVSGCIWTLLPLIAHTEFGFSVTKLGGLFALMSTIGIVGLGPAAWISDNFGRKTTILPAVGLVSASLVMIPFATTQEQLMALVGLYAMGATLVNSTPSAFVADITHEENRGQALALLRSAGDGGLMVGASLFGAIAHTSSPAVAFGAAAVAVTAAGINFTRRGEIKKAVEIKVENKAESKVDETKAT